MLATYIDKPSVGLMIYFHGDTFICTVQEITFICHLKAALGVFCKYLLWLLIPETGKSKADEMLETYRERIKGNLERHDLGLP